jgi:hypothetical protein
MQIEDEVMNFFAEEVIPVLRKWKFMCNIGWLPKFG